MRTLQLMLVCAVFFAGCAGTSPSASWQAGNSPDRADPLRDVPRNWTSPDCFAYVGLFAVDAGPYESISPPGVELRYVDPERRLTRIQVGIDSCDAHMEYYYGVEIKPQDASLPAVQFEGFLLRLSTTNETTAPWYDALVSPEWYLGIGSGVRDPTSALRLEASDLGFSVESATWLLRTVLPETTETDSFGSSVRLWFSNQTNVSGFVERRISNPFPLGPGVARFEATGDGIVDASFVGIGNRVDGQIGLQVVLADNH